MARCVDRALSVSGRRRRRQNRAACLPGGSHRPRRGRPPRPVGAARARIRAGSHATTGAGFLSRRRRWNAGPKCGNSQLEIAFAEGLTMRIRLNGWQRIGVVLSLIWVAVGWVWGAHELGYEASFFYREVPMDNEANDTRRDNCTAEAATAFKWCNSSSKLASEACGPPGAREPGCEVIDIACEKELYRAPRKIGASLHRANQIQGSHALSARGWHGTAWLLRFEPTL